MPTSANGRGTGIVRSVPVVVSGSTAVSTAALPITLPSSVFRTVSGAVTPASALATIRALQSTGGGTFEIASTAAASDTGAYSLFPTQAALPAGTPVVGTYQTTLPIPLTADAAAAGKYGIQATSASGTVSTQQVNVTVGNVIQNFAF